MALLERDSALRGAADYLAEAASGHGRLVLVAGEAGVGKTTFVDAVVRAAGGAARVAQGGCDGSSTPSPLGPLREMLADLPDGVWPEGAERHDVFTRLSETLRAADPPYLLVIEDAHWADDATLDLLRYLARRIHRWHAMVLVTYRVEEVTGTHPLRIVLGDVASAPGTPAHRPRPPDREGRARPGGGATRVPRWTPTSSTARPAATPSSSPRYSRPATPRCPAPSGTPCSRGPRASRPRRARRWTSSRSRVRAPRWRWSPTVAPGSEVALDEALGAGVLHVTGDALMFRHEIARLTVMDEVSTLRRIALHRRILEGARVDAGRRSRPDGAPRGSGWAG